MEWLGMGEAGGEKSRDQGSGWSDRQGERGTPAQRWVNPGSPIARDRCAHLECASAEGVMDQQSLSPGPFATTSHRHPRGLRSHERARIKDATFHIPDWCSETARANSARRVPNVRPPSAVHTGSNNAWGPRPAGGHHRHAVIVVENPHLVLPLYAYHTPFSLSPARPMPDRLARNGKRTCGSGSEGCARPSRQCGRGTMPQPLARRY